jgi:protein-S-isoprenylcysteine O-methyltransferase Ste14
MPVSAYFKAGLFVVAAAAALFAAAGTIAVPGFWAYLAIFAVVMIVSFAALDPDLLRERMRPGGKKPPLSLRVFSLVLFMHWIVAGLDRGRFHWSDDVPDWLQGVCLFTVAAGYALALWAMRVNRFSPQSFASRPTAASTSSPRGPMPSSAILVTPPGF